MEAGNRCFDQNVPEEINRKIVDHISDINLPYTEHSRRYLLSEGFRKEHIFVTGSPMPEVLAQAPGQDRGERRTERAGAGEGAITCWSPPTARRTSTSTRTSCR